MFFHLFLLIVYAVFCFLVAYVGRNTTIGFLGMLILSILLNPLLVAFLYVVFKPRNRSLFK